MAIGGFTFQPGGAGSDQGDAQRKRVGGYGAAPQGAPSQVSLRSFSIPAQAQGAPGALSPLLGRPFSQMGGGAPVVTPGAAGGAGGPTPEFLRQLMQALGGGSPQAPSPSPGGFPQGPLIPPSGPPGGPGVPMPAGLSAMMQGGGRR